MHQRSCRSASRVSTGIGDRLWVHGLCIKLNGSHAGQISLAIYPCLCALRTCDGCAGEETTSSATQYTPDDGCWMGQGHCFWMTMIKAMIREMVITMINDECVGCEFGDRASWCPTYVTSRLDCYNEGDTCCQSCEPFRVNITGNHYTQVTLKY